MDDECTEPPGNVVVSILTKHASAHTSYETGNEAYVGKLEKISEKGVI